MSPFKEFFRVTKDFFALTPMLLFKPPKDSAKQSMGRLLQETAAKFPDKPAITFEGKDLSWFEFNALVNQFAHLLKKQGVKRGDTVAVLMENRIEMLASQLALAKIGATAGLINTSLTGKALVHCITITGATKFLMGEELIDSITQVKSQLGLKDKDYLWVKDVGQSGFPDWAFDMSVQLARQPTYNPPETLDIRAGEKACYIFTSGTTGLPKAAVIYHRRFIAGAEPMSNVGLKSQQTDRIYLCLPLYHITGLLVGMGGSLVSGASIFLRRRFSASRFWSEVQQHQCTSFVYVGELCRYLALQAPSKAEENNPLQTMMGNGLRPDVWDDFRERFKVKRICEIYGSSEGNVVFMNVLNKDKTIGTTTVNIMLAKYDVDNDELVKDKNGKLIEVKAGEIGLLLSEIDKKYLFDGYENKKATDSKILHGVRKKSDRWFNTGDLIRKIDVGFAMGLSHYQFVDRTGDTFRWRSENVSTNEVGETLNAHDQVDIANVYGVAVAGTEGKAGMAALTLKAGASFDVSAFSEFVEQQLPAFARPVFLRLQKEAETTVTFKLLKGNLQKEAYHANACQDPLYVLKPKSNQYEPLEAAFYQRIMAGSAGY